MTFRLHALPRGPFQHLFEMSDEALAAHNGRRVIADSTPGFPCRISLTDAAVGDEVLLVNYQHLPGRSPYAASHAIYVRRDAEQAQPAPGQIPESLSTRLLSVRAFDAERLMVDADVLEGAELAAALEAMLANRVVDCVDIHYAKRGCFAARATRC